MRARLVRRAGRARLSSTSIRGASLRIGRDLHCGLVVDRPRVSRHHAELRKSDARHTIVDLGSTNGTTVNGQNVGRRAVALCDGDRIEIADEIAFVYEVLRGPELLRPGFGFAALMVLMALFLVSRPPAHPDISGEARDLAVAGRQAAQRADWKRTSEDLSAAAGLTVAAGPLRDLPHTTAQRIALEQLTAEIGSEEDLWALFQSALALAERPFGPPIPGCRLDTASSQAETERCLAERIDEIVVHLGSEGPIPQDFRAAIASDIALRQVALSAELEESSGLRRQLVAELESAGFPGELAFLATPGLDSEAGGTDDGGPWNFSPSAARRYGLRVSAELDERRDPGPSSRAAGLLLRDLAFELGTDSFLLAAAGFGHERALRKGLQALGAGASLSKRRIWLLWERKLLGQEASNDLVAFFSRALVSQAGFPRQEPSP